jgi:hypothetical protein
MKIFGIQLMLAILPAAGQPTPAMTLKVWNEAHLDDQMLLKTRKEVTSILGRAGVSLVWADCVAGFASWTSKDPCMHDDDFQLSITADKPPNATPDKAGFSEVGGSATVYYPTVASRARYFFMDASQILAATIAHELGHLILGANAHTPEGVMRTDWGPEQFKLIGAGKLVFSRDQAKLIQTEVKRRVSEGKQRPQLGSDHR